MFISPLLFSLFTTKTALHCPLEQLLIVALPQTIDKLSPSQYTDSFDPRSSHLLCLNVLRHHRQPYSHHTTHPPNHTPTHSKGSNTMAKAIYLFIYKAMRTHALVAIKGRWDFELQVFNQRVCGICPTSRRILHTSIPSSWSIRCHA